MAETGQHNTLLRELRRLFLRPPEKRQISELKIKIHNSLESFTADRENFWQTGEFAVLLYMLILKILSSEDCDEDQKRLYLEGEESLSSSCLKALTRLGLFGLSLVAKILSREGIQDEELQIWLSELPISTALDVVKQLIPFCYNQPSKLRPVLQTFRRASEMSGTDAANYLVGAEEQKDPLPFVIVDAFMNGRYGKECGKALNLPESMDEIMTFAKSLPAYTDHELIESLCIHLKSGDVRCMRAVLDTINRIIFAPAKMISEALIPQAESPTTFINKKALYLLAKLDDGETPVLFAELFTANPKLRASIINRIPYFDRDSFSSFLEHIDPKNHQTILSAVFTIISEVDPRGMALQLNSVLKEESLDNPRTSEAVSMLKSKIILPKVITPKEPAELTGREIPGYDFLKVGAPIVLNIEKSQKRKGFHKIFGKITANNEHAETEIYTEEKFLNQRVHKLNRWKCRSSELHFTGCTFEVCNFREGTMHGCKFTFCVFKACTFCEAIMVDCIFSDCEFEACNLTGSVWHSGALVRSSFKGCCNDKISISSLVGIETLFEACSMQNALFHDCRLLRTSFMVCDLSQSRFQLGLQSGMEYEKTILNKTYFCKIKILSSNFSGAYHGGCLAEAVDSQEAALLEAESNRLMDAFDRREASGTPIRTLGSLNDKGHKLIRKTVINWIDQRGLKRKLKQFSANNSRRTSWALKKFSPKACDIFLLLPYLLHTDILEQFFEVEGSPVRTVVSGYQPRREVLNICEEYFPDITPGPIGENPVKIETILTIGSIGTMSQTQSSDIDYWICCDLSTVTREQKQWLENRFQILEEWTLENLKTEIHFFLMDVLDVRNNNFGESDTESSGSAQGAILKEEFYRSALLVAGKPPLWWFVPPEAGDETYRLYASKAESLLGKEAFVDLGHVPNIPGEEFFGAALWQIVKGIKSPFKSIMKFGLLERYTSGDKKPLLCETIKRNILEGHREIARVDPYMLLYREVAEFYSQKNMPENVWLAAMSLRLKSGMLTISHTDKIPLRSEERELLNFIRQEVSKESKEQTESKNFLTDFSSVLKLGKKINLFMIQTYSRVRKSQEGNKRSLINPEDLTKLGRKISANFVEREYKINRLLLPGERTNFFDSILLSRQGSGKWILHGEYPDPTGARNILTEAGSQKDLSNMLTWFALNKLYDPQMGIKIDLSSNPVRERDVRSLLNKLCSFFPHDETFDTPIEEMLNPERMKKVLFIINLTSASELDKIDSIHAVYSTNWGELFCRPMPVNKEIVDNPGAFLCEKFKRICPELPEITQFVPSRAMCPHLNIKLNVENNLRTAAD